MAKYRVLTEFGMGSSLRRQDYTQAAKRALQDALWHNSINMAELFGFPKEAMIIDVDIAVGSHNVDADHLPSRRSERTRCRSANAAGDAGDECGTNRHARQPNVSRLADGSTREHLRCAGVTAKQLVEAVPHFAFNGIPASKEFDAHAISFVHRKHRPQVGLRQSSSDRIRAPDQFELFEGSLRWHDVIVEVLGKCGGRRRNRFSDRWLDPLGE